MIAFERHPVLILEVAGAVVDDAGAAIARIERAQLASALVAALERQRQLRLRRRAGVLGQPSPPALGAQ